MNNGFYEVSLEWLHACGYRQYTQPTAFPVVRTWMAGHMPFVAVRLPNGNEWELNAEWRGRFV